MQVSLTIREPEDTLKGILLHPTLSTSAHPHISAGAIGVAMGINPSSCELRQLRAHWSSRNFRPEADAGILGVTEADFGTNKTRFRGRSASNSTVSQAGGLNGNWPVLGGVRYD